MSESISDAPGDWYFYYDYFFFFFYFFTTRRAHAYSYRSRIIAVVQVGGRRRRNPDGISGT